MTQTPINTKDTTLSDFLKSNDETQIRIPIYQRPFTWGKPGDTECNNKLRDFVEVIKDLASDFNTHKFFGFIVTFPEGSASYRQRKYFHLIDGQQRLTSISLIYIYLISRLDLLIRDINDSQDKSVKILDAALNLKHSLKTKYVIFDSPIPKTEYTETDLRLRVGRRDIKSFLGLVNGATLTEPNAIFNGYCIIQEELQDDEEKEQNFSREDFDKRLEYIVSVSDALKRLHVAVLCVEDPKLGINSIFESINFKGEKLSDFDLIRNFIIEHYEFPDRAEDMYNRIWYPFENIFNLAFGDDEYEKELGNSIYSHLRYLAEPENKISRKAIYEKFREIYETSNGEYLITEKNILDIIEKCITYLILKKPEASLDSITSLLSEDFKSRLKFDRDTITSINAFSERNYSVPIPFLMAVILKRNMTDSKILLDAVNVVISFFVRHELSNGTTKSLAQPFANLKSAFISDYPQRVTSLQVWFKENLCKSTRGGLLSSIYPNDKQVKDYLLIADVYNKHSETIKFVMFELNKHLMGRAYDSTVCKHYELDHIMPQTLSEEWKKYLFTYHKEPSNAYEKHLHLLGNLTLVPKVLNSQIGNTAYSDRAEEYRKAALLLTNQLHEKYSPNKWNFSIIKDRNNELIELILKRFS
jgi:uncharacterized protein with ParB-like and HNH nuclease domain